MSDFVPFFDEHGFPVAEPALERKFPTCIVCDAAPGTYTAYIEKPSGATLLFPCCWACLSAAAEPEGRERLFDAANRCAIALAGKPGGSA